MLGLGSGRKMRAQQFGHRLHPGQHRGLVLTIAQELLHAPADLGPGRVRHQRTQPTVGHHFNGMVR